MSYLNQINQTADFLKARIKNSPRFGVILGTGLGALVEKIKIEVEIPYEERDHALYIAFGPYKNPRYALSILVEHGGNGSTTAAPMAKELFKMIIDRHQKRDAINNKRYLEI